MTFVQYNSKLGSKAAKTYPKMIAGQPESICIKIFGLGIIWLFGINDDITAFQVYEQQVKRRSQSKH